MTSARPRLRLVGVVAAFAAASLGLGLLSAPAAQAISAGPFVIFADATTSYSLHVGDVTGAGASLVTTGGMQTDHVASSEDGTVLAISGSTGDSTTPLFDTTAGLIVSVNGVTQSLASSTNSNPVVAADGSAVWFAAAGNLFVWTRSTGLVTQVTTSSPLATTTGEGLWGLAVSPDGNSAAAVFRKVNFSTQPPTATGSRISVFATTAAATVSWSYSYPAGAGTSQLLFDPPTFVDSTTVYFGECLTGGCDEWKYLAVDLSLPTPTTSATAGDLDNTYSLRSLAGTWYAWEDSGSPSVTSSKTSTNLTSWTPGAARTDGDHTLGYTPVSAAPAAFSSRQSSTGAPAAQPHFALSAGLVKTAGQAVYASYAYYFKGVGTQTFDKDAFETDRGALQWSTDAGRTWHPLGYTTSKTVVAWPGGGSPGNGRTPKLYRNTWFRWTVPGDVFVARASTSPRLVRVTPTVKATVVRSGSKRTVAGTVARSGGTAVLYKGTKKIATVKISSKGAYSFGKRVLSRGTYTVFSPADVSWAAGALTLKI